jgi:hypothetical protein
VIASCEAPLHSPAARASTRAAVASTDGAGVGATALDAAADDAVALRLGAAAAGGRFRLRGRGGLTADGGVVAAADTHSDLSGATCRRGGRNQKRRTQYSIGTSEEGIRNLKGKSSGQIMRYS